jgi:DNA-binding transcriptional MerR regulator
MTPPPPLWTIDELSAWVARALSVGYAGSPSSRVRDVPDRRTIRYYTTLGLIDRPQMRGRTALYTRRHLVQLVAIKRLQAQGLSLAEVQQRLLGLPEAALAELARLPDLEALPPGEKAEEPGTGPFWARAPAPVAPKAESPETALPWQGVPLSDQVLLLFEPAQLLGEEDLAAIQSAAAPLLQLLETRRLLRPREERGPP